MILHQLKHEALKVLCYEKKTLCLFLIKSYLLFIIYKSVGTFLAQLLESYIVLKTILYP